MGRRSGARPRTRGLLRYAVTALLGLSGRRVPTADRRPDRARSASSYEAPLAADPMLLGRAAQLPPTGRGNGVEALLWTPIARLAPERVEAVLAALAAEDLAAWAAPVPRPPGVRGGADRPHDLWVGSLRLDAAQDVLLRALAEPGARPSEGEPRSGGPRW
jgi:hypothetical protein